MQETLLAARSRSLPERATKRDMMADAPVSHSIHLRASCKSCAPTVDAMVSGVEEPSAALLYVGSSRVGQP